MTPASQSSGQGRGAGRDGRKFEDRRRVDRQVGLRIRMRRKELGVSQDKLAEALGLTLQQVQKYEGATTRVSASQLYEIACALNTSVSYFFEGLPEPSAAGGPLPPSAGGPAGDDLLLSRDGAEIATLFQQLVRRRLRRNRNELLRALAEDEPPLESDGVCVEDGSLEVR